MGNNFYFDWEVDLIEWVQQNAGTFGQAFVKIFSFIGGEIFSLLVMMVVLFCYKKELGKRCAFTLITASMCFPMIKNILLRIRPYIAHQERIQALSIVEPDANPMDSVQQGFSFPSGHCSMSVATYGTIARDIRKRWMWFLAVALPLLIGLSRFMVGVHYPTDVLAGWAIGLLAIGFSILMEKLVKKEWLRYVILLAITLPGVFWCTSRDYFSSLGVLIGLVAAVPYEQKYVQFQDTRNVWAMILRIVGAFTIYLVLDKVLKLPFSSDWLNSGKLGPNLIRTARYAIILFIAVGLYPKVFPVFEKVGKKSIQNS